MHIQAKDLRVTTRENIPDLVPLSAPFALFIDTGNPCNYKCVFCPTGHPELLKQHGRKPVFMSYEFFCKIVDDLREFPRKIRRVNLYKDGEPLLNKRFPDMVQYLRDAQVAESIWVKTNGQLLAPDLNSRLVACGLDMIGISVTGIDAQMFLDVAKVKVDYEEYRAGVLDLYKQSRGTGVRISTKIADVGLSNEQKQKFLDDFSDRCDFIAIENLHGWSTSNEFDFRLGTEKSFDGLPRVDKVVCPLTLYMLAINSNGDISICNDDQYHLHQLGSVAHESLFDIWHGERLKAFRVMHLEGRRAENAACKGCDYVKVLPDNVDARRLEILERIK